jgi:hypothetical protein
MFSILIFTFTWFQTPSMCYANAVHDKLKKSHFQTQPLLIYLRACSILKKVQKNSKVFEKISFRKILFEKKPPFKILNCKG